MNDMPVTPVLGYSKQSDQKLKAVNWNKVVEERLLRDLERMAQAGVGGDPVDARWIAIAKTEIEKAFMAWNRAIMQPRRPTDEEIRNAFANAPD